MTRRSVSDIIEEWRAAERELPTDGSDPQPDLVERIDSLRTEHEAAVDSAMGRNGDIQDPGRLPLNPGEATG
jgi:hypothetical protein